MYFLDRLLSKETHTLRQRLVDHDLWKKIADGTLEKERLAIFALQDYWLIQQARRIDGLTIAGVQDRELQNLLMKRLTFKHTGKGTIFDFGEGVGLTREDFTDVVPLAGCMALTTFFYWMIDYTSDAEKVAAIMASVAVFSDICLQVYKPLMEKYGFNETQVGFFTAHDKGEEKVHPMSEYIEKTYTTKEEQKKIAEAVHLSHEHEMLFYNTVLQTPLR
jgi:thiaminase